MTWADCIFQNSEDCVWQDWDDCIWNQPASPTLDRKTRIVRKPVAEGLGSSRRPYLEGNPSYVEDNQRFSDMAIANASIQAGVESPPHMVFKQPYRYEQFQKMKYMDEPIFPHHETISAQTLEETPGGILGKEKEVEYEWVWVRYFDDSRWSATAGEWTSGVWLIGDDVVIAQLMIHSNTTDGSQLFIDSGLSGHTVTYAGNVQHSTTQKKFGTSSIYFDGSGNDYLDIASHADFALGTGDFTIDFWLYLVAEGNVTYIAITDYADGLSMREDEVTGGTVGAYVNGTLNNWAWLSPTDEWHHLALERVDDSLYCYVDGSSLGTAADVSEKSITQGPVRIGLHLGGATSAKLEGYIDELRILKGTSAYGGINFTAPTAAYAGGDILTAISDWAKNFRPRKVRIEFDNATADVSLQDSDEHEIYANSAYSSTDEVLLDFAGGDIDRLLINGSGNITDIEFEQRVVKGSMPKRVARKVSELPIRKVLPDPKPIPKKSPRSRKIHKLRTARALPSG